MWGQQNKFPITNLGKQGQIKPKVGRRKEITKTWKESNEIENI